MVYSEGMKRQTILRLGLLLGVSLLLRLWFLGQHPAGFYYDEVFAGYNAYSILQTGRNVHSEFLPLYLNTFGDWRPMAIVYLIIPFVRLLGLSEFAVRLGPALVAAITPGVLYLVLQRGRLRGSVAYLSALFLSLSPWHNILSRSTSETMLAVLLLCLLLLSSYEVFVSLSRWKWVLMYGVMLVMIFSHAGGTLLVITLAPILLLVWRRKFKDQDNWKVGMVVWFIWLLFPLGFLTLFGHTGGRASQVVEIVTS